MQLKKIAPEKIGELSAWLLIAAAYYFPLMRYAALVGLDEGDVAFNAIQQRRVIEGLSACLSYPPVNYMGLTESIFAMALQTVTGFGPWPQVIGISVWLFLNLTVIAWIARIADIPATPRAVLMIAFIAASWRFNWVGMPGWGGHVMIFPLACVCFLALWYRRYFWAGALAGFSIYSYDLFLVFMPALCWVAWHGIRGRSVSDKKVLGLKFLAGGAMGLLPRIFVLIQCPATTGISRANVDWNAWHLARYFGEILPFTFSVEQFQNARYLCAWFFITTAFLAYRALRKSSHSPQKESFVRVWLIFSIIAFSGVAAATIVYTSVIYEYRYMVTLYPLVVSILMASARLSGRFAGTFIYWLLLSLALVNTTSYYNALRNDHGLRADRIFALGNYDQTTFRKIIRRLEENDVDVIVGDYQASYAVMYRSGQEILAHSFDRSRIPEFEEKALLAPRKAFVFTESGVSIETMTSVIEEYAGDVNTFSKETIDDRVLFLPR